ncbi:isochorismate synthase [Myxococcaceae bacterium GXIMD 01537]
MMTHTPVERQPLVAGMNSLSGADPLAGADVLGVPSVYWERPLAQEAVAGWGEALVVEARDAAQAREVFSGLLSRAEVHWLEGAPEELPGPWFGGMRFAAGGEWDTRWAAHGFARWVVPEVLVWRSGGGLSVAALAPESKGGADAVRSRLARVRAAFPATYRHPRGGAVALSPISSRPRFEALVRRAVEAISQELFQKVVLARAVDVEAPTDFDVVDVLARLREQNPRCATFCLRAPDGSLFLGATPETLCRVRGRMLETEALAGSAAPEQGEALGAQDKDRREHQSVVQDIAARLRLLADTVDVDAEPALLALKNVVHLRTGIRAELREGVGPAQVVEALHPTPAVGGSPRERALGFLLENEGMDRGWYSGPVGWVGPHGAHLAVALRSARVAGAKARLFVGAGIVAGSTAESEWRETELKALTMLRALGGGDV